MDEFKFKNKFIDLETQYQRIKPETLNAVKDVLEGSNFIMGEQVNILEKELAKFVGCKHVKTCANGTDAITIALLALGLEKNDVVFMPSFNYVASAEAVSILGGIPYFVDVDEETFNINPSSLKQAISLAKSQKLKISGVIPVELFGLPVFFEEINEIAKENNLWTIVDSAQSFGSNYKGKVSCSYGDISTTSFFPAKPLGCYGDGGAMFTNSKELSEKIDSIRLHGRGIHKYEHIRIGMNSRLDTIQAAILIQKLKIFSEEIAARRKNADLYLELINHKKMLPRKFSEINSAWAQFTLKTSKRDELKKILSVRNIPSMIYYPIPLHKQTAYKMYPCADSMEISEKLCDYVLSIPMHPYLSKEDQIYISSTINDFFYHQAP